MKIRNNLVLIGVLTGAFASGVALASLGAFETWIVRDLSVPHALTGLAQSALYIGDLIGSLAAGWLMYKLSSKRVGMLALASLLAGSILSGVKVYEVIIIGRLLAGLGFSGMMIFCGAVIAHCYPKQQASLLSLFHAMLATGAAIMLFAGRPLATAIGDWTWVILLGGLISLIPLAAFASTGLTPMDEERFSPASMSRVLRNSVIVSALFVLVAYVVAEQAVTVFFISFVQNELALPAAMAGGMAALFWAGLMVGRFGAAFVGRQLSEVTRIVGCMIGMAAFMLIGLVARQLGVVFVATFLAGLFAGPVVPLAFSYGLHGAGRLKSVAVASCNVAACLGGIAGPAIVGMIGDRSSLATGLALSAILLPLSLAPIVFAMRKASFSGVGIGSIAPLPPAPE